MEIMLQKFFKTDKPKKITIYWQDNLYERLTPEIVIIIIPKRSRFKCFRMCHNSVLVTLSRFSFEIIPLNIKRS